MKSKHKLLNLNLEFLPTASHNYSSLEVTEGFIAY